MKRFITISLLAAIVVPALACIWVETHNYYLFSVYDREEFRTRVDQISRDNWKAYLGLGEDESFWFNAERIEEFAQQKGDALMVSYVQQLDRYLECIDTKRRQQYDWDYPSREEIDKMNKSLTEIRTYAQGKLTSRLRSQHALLFMRCNMMLGKHSENVSFWEQTASKYIETVYKDMMLNIYAGALARTAHGNKAGQIFAEQGDWQSLMTQYYKRRSYDAIRQEYLRDPQSAVLPFLLQDFVNNAQEAYDHDGMGKLFVRDIQRSEALQMIQLAGQAAREGKTQHPALWLSAKAWLEYMFDSKVQALADINKAVTLEDTERMKDNARILQFYITAMQTPSPTSSFEDYVAAELQWLDQKKQDDVHYDNAQDRIVHQALAPKFIDAGQSNVALALLSAVHDHQYETIDTMTVGQLLSYIDYAKRPAVSKLDRYLKPKLKIDDTEMNDLLGTKHLRLCQWEDAIKYLEKVPLPFYNERGYAVYVAHRSYTVEPWITRQWLKDDVEWGTQDLPANPKLVFAREMLKMEKDLTRMSGKKRCQQCFDLAVRYAQASFTGDCWYLMRNSKSVLDKVRPNETDLSAKAADLLRQAAATNDARLKERALFALAYIYLNTDVWYEQVWNSEQHEMQRVPQPNTSHYRSWATLFNFYRTNALQPADYVQRCDEYIQFKKQYR